MKFIHLAYTTTPGITNRKQFSYAAPYALCRAIVDRAVESFDMDEQFMIFMISELKKVRK